MGCSTSSQTSAVDTTRPSAKPEESNGASTTGVANENGNVAEDSETIPDQTAAQTADAKPAGDPSADSTAAGVPAEGTAAAPPTGEEPQPEAASQPAAPEDAPAAAAAEGEASPPEEGKAEATAEEAPAPSE